MLTGAATRPSRALLTALCTRCRKYFNVDMTDLAAPGSHYTWRVVDSAVRLVIEDGLPYRTASWNLCRASRVRPLCHDPELVEDGGKGAATNRRRLPRLPPTDFGYIAADELYDGPFCILSIVDNRRSRDSPTRFWTMPPPAPTSWRSSAHFHAALVARGLSLQGITTDGRRCTPKRSPRSSAT